MIILVLIYISNASFRMFIDKYIFQKYISEEALTDVYVDINTNNKAYAYGKYLAVLESGNISIYNKNGNLRKNEKMYFPLASPIGQSNGNYLLLASKDGKNVVCIGEDKLSWEREFDYNINNININKSGYATIIGSNNAYKSIVTVISKYGEELFNIYMSSNIVVNAEVSPDNKVLAIAEVNSSKAIIESTVKFLSIEDAMKNPRDSIIKEYSRNKLITNIKYKLDGNLIAQYSDKIFRYNNDEEQELIEISDNVSFVDIRSDRNIVLVEKNEEATKKQQYQISIYTSRGRKKGIYIIGESLPKDIILSGNTMAINLGQELRILSENGRERKKYVSTKEIRDIILSDEVMCILYKSKISLTEI